MSKEQQTKSKLEDTLSSADSEMSRDRSVSPQLDDSIGSPKAEQDIPRVTVLAMLRPSLANLHPPTPRSSWGRSIPELPDYQFPENYTEVSTTDSRINSPINLSTPTKGSDVAGDDEKPLNMKSNRSTPNGRVVDRGLTSHPERKRRASDEISLDSSTTKASETGTLDETKDDDDDDDNDDDEKMPPGFEYDPETLKAFNMFVRLFVDENLDRVVPISKQPKDKIQAILDACDRQFPTFRERSRKRIRTYLKSCRRMRRSKEQNGWEPLRPTPPHLTSAAAEGLLAQACENESQNAKRMRMGLEPLPASVMNQVSPVSNYISQQSNSTSSAQLQHSPKQSARDVPAQNHSSSTPTPAQQTSPMERSLNSHDLLRQQPPTSATAAAAAAAAFRPPHEFQPPFFANGNGLFRPGFGSGYQTPAHHHPQVLAHTPLQHNNIQNGPTDLSLKKGSQKSQLSVSEVATIKQLIAGYRESAAFLYRSADELEQLLLQQN